MSAALKNPQESGNSGVVEQTMLLNYFSLSGEFLHVQESHLGGDKYFLSQAGSANLAGFGRAVSKRLSLVKAIAEHFERRLMFEVFSHELKSTPFWLQTSNGFAVHFSQENAIEASKKEALERHILQLTFFRYGWAGFTEIGEAAKAGDLTLRKLLSRYSCAGFRAGIIVATSPRFAGASFGYICEGAEEILASPRWGHATHEAVDKIDPLLAIHETKWPSLLPLTQETLIWLKNPVNVTPSPVGDVVELDKPRINTQTFALDQRWGFGFSFWGAYSSSEGLLPLIVPGRTDFDQLGGARALLNKFGLTRESVKRNPIL